MNFTPQHDQMDCGPACLAMVASRYGRKISLAFLRNQSYLAKDGVSLSGIMQAAQTVGFEALSAKCTIEKLAEHKDALPCILHWNQNHFVVLRKIKGSLWQRIFNPKSKIKNPRFHIADPAHGFITLSVEKFCQSWIADDNKGVALFLSPTEAFYNNDVPQDKKLSLKEIFAYLVPYRKSIAVMFLLLLLGSGLTLLFPFLTQKLIDKGIAAKDLNIVSVLLLAQLGVFVGSITIEIIRNWLMLYIGTKVSISIISDFLKKLLELPIKFFETKMMGDFNQRIQDNERIEDFLTSQSLSTFFSLITFLVFFGVLWHYDTGIMLVYLVLTALALGWSFFWLKRRKILDYLKFQQRSENQESIYEIINSVEEMKLNMFEDFKRKEWEQIQQKLFKINTRILKVNQLQLSGFELLNQVKNIFVTFLAAVLVIKGSMTLGELLAISFIIGQLNSPINQLVGFFRSLQDAKLSMERLNEVQNETPEEQADTQIPLGIHADINIQNLSFQYEGPQSPFVLQNINLTIPKGKITAIVGASGSGKTTLMKLLLRFYEPTSGNIFIGTDNLNVISPKSLRQHCGVVMQDGYIFADSIERNIATGDENINTEKLHNAVAIANIATYINELPLKFKTKIGASGNGISGGQKQRMLIARAVYKNPHYIFFDEATSALDAENEKIIHENLQTFFKGKTVLIIAHRLSTVKNADQILVLHKGKIAETGTHEKLTTQKGQYYELVKNQLELGE
ncbi:MAG: peptidase domain-containing ABC transporter [Edaphocola sp.]